MFASQRVIRSSIGFSIAAGLLMLTASASAVDYLRDIKPVLKARCYSCHGALKQKADLRVDTALSMIAAKAVLPGDAAGSELIKRISNEDDDERMPPEGHALKEDQIAAIRSWIASNAPLPKDEAAEDDPRSHWSFQAIQRPPLPADSDQANPVDRFLAARQKEAGLITQAPALRTIQLRRLYIDLIGLPPTEKQLKDERPWETIVDELLASPHHGERWGRHWMDIWRYSDWYGLGAQLRYSQKHLWHWRDWIVESLNEDKGYDEMIIEMLAGDEIAPEDPETLRATGFLARNYFLFNRTTWLDSTIEHTGKAFLGLTFNCAKCHDHKYDPIEAEDYYRFRAIFEPHQVRLDPVPGVTDFEKDGLPRVFDNHLDAETFLHQRGDPKQPDKELKITPGVPRFLSQFATKIEPVKLPLPAYAPGTQPFVQRDHLAAADTLVEKARENLEKVKVEMAKNATLEKSPAKKAPHDSESNFPLEDDFTAFNPLLWTLQGNGLAYKNGHLEQINPSREPGQLVSKHPLPRDFEVTCRYTTTGGPTYRSISFRFDRDEAGKNANFIYTSEHAPGPKVQAAYTENGKTTYPADGRAKKSEATGKPQELRIAVRDQLANVWLNGEFVLAYTFPGRRADGHFSLSAFDATAEFHSIRIEALGRDVQFTKSKNTSESDSEESLDKTLRLAELELESAIAGQESVKATIAADTAHYDKTKAPAPALEKAATEGQIKEMEARAAFEMAKHEGGDKKKLSAATALKKKAEGQREALQNGTAAYKSLRASRKALETPAHKVEDYPSVYPEESTGRRTMLAKWITAPENPLTARVAVNHVWMRHFGEPLVETVSDFGRQAKKPIHHDLLDFLAAEFIESGWSFRHLHRLLVTSQTYQLSSSNRGASGENLQLDPTNSLYWKMNPMRMESQVVRDSLLHLAGDLDLTTGGPSLDSGNAKNRRSLYFTHSPDKLDQFLTTFDDADLLQCYRRSTSIVPQQALALSNSAMSLQSAEKIATKIGLERAQKDFITAAFDLILGRSPDSSEVEACETFLSELATLSAEESNSSATRFRNQLVHALLNHNDFVTVR